VFTLVDYHFIQDFRGSCLYGNTSYTGFVECSDSSQSQWYQLPLTGSWGPVANCWCTSQDDCRRPCNEDDVLAVAVPTKDQASAMLVESLVLSANFTTFYFSYF
jgi:hypothetical protein